MNDFETSLVKEGLNLLEQALDHFDEDSDHPMIAVVAKLVHSAIVVGGSLIGSKECL